MKNKKKQHIRIVGGTHRSRIIHFIESPGLRPTADSVRERLFNWLGQRLDQKKVLDLFSGSGVLAFEAASRGAQHITLVEQSSHVCSVLEQNRSNLALTHADIYCMNALTFLSKNQQKYDLIFLDPPYNWQDWHNLWILLEPKLNPSAAIYIEQNQEIRLPEYLHIQKQGKSGMSCYVLAQYAPQ